MKKNTKIVNGKSRVNTNIDELGNMQDRKVPFSMFLSKESCVNLVLF